MLIAKDNPSLAVYKHRLTLVHAQLAHWQSNEKYSKTLLKRLTATFTTSKKLGASRIPHWIMYATHLTGISQALSLTPPDYKAAFGTIQDLLTLAEKNQDHPVIILTHILHLRTLVDAAMWDAVEDALSFAESILGLSFNDSSPSPKGKEIANNDFIHFDDAFEAAMAIHTLQLGVVYYTHVGKARAATPRLHHLHALLDSDSLNHFATGTLEVIFFVNSSAMHLLN